MNRLNQHRSHGPIFDWSERWIFATSTVLWITQSNLVLITVKNHLQRSATLCGHFKGGGSKGCLLCYQNARGSRRDTVFFSETRKCIVMSIQMYIRYKWSDDSFLFVSSTLRPIHTDLVIVYSSMFFSPFLFRSQFRLVWIGPQT